MQERQKDGIARAKAEGKYKGSAQTAMQKSNEISFLLKEGYKNTEIAKKLNIGIASVHRVRRN